MLRCGLPSALLLLLAASSSLLSAQTIRTEPAPVRDTVRMAEPLGGYQARQGFWLGGGLGYGSVKCGPAADAIGGATATLEAGWTLSRRFLLGVGTSMWNRGYGRLGVTIGSIDLRARWYPSELAGGLFLTGAWGLGIIRFSDVLADPSSYTAKGRAFRAGLGYDLRVASGVSLTPFATGSKINTNDDGDTMSAEVWQLGIEVTVH
jgi:hypothetical protein